MSRLSLKFLNGVYDLVAGVLIFSAVAFSVYSIWDNAQIYLSAEDVQDSIRQYRPDLDEDGTPLGFDELRAINPDVVAWLTMEGTNIDYPVLQGKDNLEYINKDVYGETSLAGSIYLDTRCDPNIQGRYSLIYGHNMDQHLMFGDLALYKDKEFFAKHTTGEILTPAERQEYQVVAVLQIPASSEMLFDPDEWKDGFARLPRYLREQSIWYHNDQLDVMEKRPWGVQVVALITCSEGVTNDRTILVLMRVRNDWHEADGAKNTPQEDSSDSDSALSAAQRTASATNSDVSSGSSNASAGTTNVRSGTETSTPKQTGDGQDPVFWYRVIGGIVVFILLYETVERSVKRRRDAI